MYDVVTALKPTIKLSCDDTVYLPASFDSISVPFVELDLFVGGGSNLKFPPASSVQRILTLKARRSSANYLKSLIQVHFIDENT